MAINRAQVIPGSFPYHKYSLDYALQSLQRLGAGYMELYAAEPHFHIDDAGIDRLMELKRKLRLYGLQPVCLTPEQMRYPINIAASDDVCRRRSVDMFAKAIAYASELECPRVLVHAGYPLNDERQPDAWARSEESLGFLCRIAERQGVTIVLEFVDVRWKTVLRNSALTAEMTARIGSAHLCPMLDTMTLAYGGERIEDALKNLGPGVSHVHLSDGYCTRKQLTHLIPGEGEIDLDHMIRVLGDEGYDGFLSMEILSPFEDEPEQAMRKCLRWADEHILP